MGKKKGKPSKRFIEAVKNLKVIYEEVEIEYDPDCNIKPIKMDKPIKIWGQKTLMRNKKI